MIMPVNEKLLYHRKTFNVNIIKYFEEFPDEHNCKEHFRGVKEHEDVRCKKCTLLSIYHKIKCKYLQLYLNEFSYKLNPRYFRDKLFDRLKIAMENGYWYNNE